MAQSVERILGKDKVSSSILLMGSTFLCRDVAQSGSALEWGSRGRRFKSSHPDHEKISQKILYIAHVAQSVERILGKDKVSSSILLMGSTFKVSYHSLFLF